MGSSGAISLPMARGIPFAWLYVLRCALVAAGRFGFAMVRSAGGTIAGFAAATALLITAIMAVHRDRQAKAG